MTYFIIAILSIIVIFLIIRFMRISSSIMRIEKSIGNLSPGNPGARRSLTEKWEIGDIAKGIVSAIEKAKTELDSAKTKAHRMEAMLRGMSDGVLIADAKGAVMLANNAFKKLLSIKEDIEKKQIMEVLRNARFIEMLDKLTDSDTIVSEEICISRGDTDMYMTATAIPVYSDGLATGLIVTLHDITRPKLLEEMRKDFVVNVSHEIKTPLTAIKGFAETLLDGAIDDRENAYKFLQTIKNQSERLNSLVNDLLTLSGIEMGDIRIEKKNVDINDVIDGVFTILEEKAHVKGLYMKKSVSPETLKIYADKDRLIQILLNLVDNAIKFTETGGVTVGIENAVGYDILYIEDTGIGVSERHQSRLGERFYRVDSARSRDMGGTGLGLAIVKHIVKAHKWDMSIKSEIGKGTRVNITLSK
ncbi:MAG: ATP-binding protein [Nitrospirae bacterium]|nr:ATP-binding protein [Nitrospirota bacterium]